MTERPSRKFVLPLAVAVTISVISGVAHGWLDGRWVNRPNLDAIAAQLKELPEQFGDWTRSKDLELPNSALRQLQCYGYTSQVYENVKTGRRLNVAVLFGPRGPIAVHTPEICYSGQGITPSGSRQREVVEVDGKEHSIWRVNFRSKVDAKPELEAYYAWSDGGNWQAAEYPRVWLTGRLYKIQLACDPTATGNTPDAIQFLEEFLPRLQPLLVSTTK